VTHRAHRGLAAISLAVAALGPMSAQAEARLAGSRPGLATEEGGLWDLFDKAEQHVKSTAELNTDPALNAYVHDVACKVAAEYCADLRIYVLDRAAFNAAAGANGYTEVWSGLLLRTTSEAELAFALGHETTHFIDNHSFERQRTTRRNANIALGAQVVVAVAGAVAAGQATTAQEYQSTIDATRNTMNLIYLNSIIATLRFTREQESQADEEGLRRTSRAGYDPAVAGRVWQAVAEETAASDFERVRKSVGRANIFADHPLEATRLAALAKEAQALPKGGEVGRARHRAAIRPHLSVWLADDLRRRDSGETLQIIDRLAADGEDLGVLNFYRGEAYRQRQHGDDMAKARDAYLKASAYPDAPVAVWRELGDLRRKDKDPAGARTAYETYLLKAPEAEDAWIVRDALSGLEKGT
jgi:predicted Zn-dependent protease